MARLGTVALGALVACLASCGASSARSTTTTPIRPTRPPRPPHCGAARVRQLAFSAQARVYVERGVVYGCSVPGRRSFRLGTVGLFRHSKIEQVAVGGRVAAYALANMGVDTGPVQVVVVRLTDGQVLGRFPATNETSAEFFQSIGSIVVASDGAVAWIGRETAIGLDQAVVQVLEVRAPASASEGTQLDSGTAIAIGSLALQGSTLTWRHGNATRHAMLP